MRSEYFFFLLYKLHATSNIETINQILPLEVERQNPFKKVITTSASRKGCGKSKSRNELNLKVLKI